jgi:hypothetical protein
MQLRGTFSSPTSSPILLIQNGLIDLSGRVHYVTRDFLNATVTVVDYMEYLAKNITAFKEKSAIIFYYFGSAEGHEYPDL